MSPFKAISALVFLAFGAYSGWVMLQVGYLGIWEAGLASPGATQVLLDLVIVCALASAWMFRDARATGRNPWPYLLVTLFAGSFGPLLYVLLAPSTDARLAPRHA